MPYFPWFFREGGSEQIREGAQVSKKPLTDHVELFLFMFRFGFRGKVDALADVDIPKRGKLAPSGSNLFTPHRNGP